MLYRLSTKIIQTSFIYYKKLIFCWKSSIAALPMVLTDMVKDSIWASYELRKIPEILNLSIFWNRVASY